MENRVCNNCGANNYYYNGNFKSHKEEVAHMRELREQGFSNAEIAKKIGRTYLCVYLNIGKQPEDMTRKNVLAGNHYRAQKNAERKQYVADHTVRTFNELIDRMEKAEQSVRFIENDLRNAKTAVEKLAQEIEAARPAAEEAAKKSAVQIKSVASAA